MKQCNKCSVVRSLNEFKKDHRNKDGRQGICNFCTKESIKLNRERRRQGIGLAIITEKTCNSCNSTKPVHGFYKDHAITDGYATICKDCKRLSVAKWRENNRERYNAKMRAYNGQNYHRLRLQRYKLTPEVHAKMMADQKGVCAICGKLPGGKRPLAVDHHHGTGTVRGLLCYGCNRALHYFDSPEFLKRAHEYLLKHQ